MDAGTTNFVLGILMLYALAMVAIGILVRRRQRGESVQQSMLGYHSAGFWLLFGSGVSMQVGSGFVVGGAEYGAIYGISGAWYGIGCGLSYITVALFTCRLMYQRGYVSLDDYFQQRYGAAGIRLTYSIAVLVGNLAMMTGQLLAGRAIFLTLGLSAEQGVILTAVVSLVYTTTTGMMGTMAMAAVQSAVIFLGITTALIVMAVQCGLPVLAHTLPETYFAPLPQDSQLWVSMVVPNCLAAMVQQGMIQRVSSARTGRIARRSFLCGGVAVLPIALVPTLLGMYGRTIFPDAPSSTVFTQLLLSRLPVAVAAVVLAALICSVLGACNSVYISSSVILIHDIYHGVLGREESGRQDGRLLWASNFVFCILGVYLACRMQDIIQILTLGYALVSSGCLIPFWGGLLWRRGNARGALLSSFAGMAVAAADAVGLIDVPYSSLTAVAASAVVYGVAGLFAPTGAAEKAREM